MAATLPVRRLGYFSIEGTSLVEDGDEVAEVGIAGRRSEVAVLVHEQLERVDEPQAPSGVGSTLNARAPRPDSEPPTHFPLQTLRKAENLPNGE